MLTLPLEDEAQCDCSGFMEEKESMCLGPHLFSPLPWCCGDIAAIFFSSCQEAGLGMRAGSRSQAGAGNGVCAVMG